MVALLKCLALPHVAGLEAGGEVLHPLLGGTVGE